MSHQISQIGTPAIRYGHGVGSHKQNDVWVTKSHFQPPPRLWERGLLVSCIDTAPLHIILGGSPPLRPPPSLEDHIYMISSALACKLQLSCLPHIYESGITLICVCLMPTHGPNTLHITLDHNISLSLSSIVPSTKLMVKGNRKTPRGIFIAQTLGESCWRTVPKVLQQSPKK